MKLLVLFLLVSSTSASNVDYTSEEVAVRFLEEYDRESLRLANAATVAAWNYKTNITEHNAKLSQDANQRSTQYESEASKNASLFVTRSFSPSVVRELGRTGSESLPEEQQRELEEVIGEMGSIYASSKVCLGGTRRRRRQNNNQAKDDDSSCLRLSKLNKIMAESTDYYERTRVWEQWRTVVGRKVKPLYERYVELKNAGARARGHADQGAAWRSGYESDDFEADVEELYAQLKPLYLELHAFVRRKLADTYGENHIDLQGPLPAHLLGDMWGRFWSPLYDLMVPYPSKPSVDPSEEMATQNYTVERIFEAADEFYASLGLPRVPESFWRLSMLRKPDDGREVQCHPTAWDFYDGKDFRIKMCGTDYSFGNMITAYHELGHVQYFMQYAHQPGVYRGGANSGFHEAIGELMAMAAATPKYLNKIGLMEELVEDEEQDINFLLSQSLLTVSTLPFHLVNDVWRWKIFRGEIPKERWNAEYWRLKREVVGVSVPVLRGGADLDPPTIFHIAQDYDMIRYFTRTILQFQFWARLCSLSGHRGPLHRCDFSGSHEAGAALAEMLKLGSSVPWQDALETLTGERKMDAGPILEFFRPLHKWLQRKNRENGDRPGWQGDLV